MYSEKLLFFLFLLTKKLIHCEKGDGIFKSDIGDQMAIGLSYDGYEKVKLHCGSNSMLIALETDNDFEGVIYTKGHYFDKNSACFLDAASKRGQRSFSIKFPLDQCNTKKDGETYTNTLVLQHDKELIMPGDAAFYLECDYSKPRDVTVKANLQKENFVISRITLTDADPAYSEKRNKRNTIENVGDSVTLTKDFLKGRKDEL